ncbi:MAG: hypothetical protein QY328_06750 [Anaerolineales bacterium]|nr:MAG: hypothetical protein QY328_06750 [Anaerolineales bacterium]
MYIPALQEVATDDQKKKILQHILDIEWLIEKRIIFDPILSHDDFEKLFSIFGQDQLSEYQDADNTIKNWKKNRKSNRIRELSSYFEAELRKDAIFLRVLSIGMNKNADYSTVTTLPESDYTLELPNSRKADIVRLVINNLPLPNTSTSWEQIIDFRSDPENQKSLLALRRWISKISRENIPFAEIQEEVKWLVNEFQRHMKFHKMKANTETLEVLVKVPFEIVENLLKLKLSKIPEPFFAIKKRQLMLMEAEINAPGKELTYIIKSRETFQSEE